MAVTDAQLIAFIYAEARLLDEQRFDRWLDLFTDDGIYWMPLQPGQQDARLHASLMHEDKLLLKVRIERLAGQRTFSQHPRSRCHHLLQRPEIEARDDALHTYRLRTNFHYVESRLDAQTLYAGSVSHDLVADGDALRIRLKRVDLINCDAALGSMQLFI